MLTRLLITAQHFYSPSLFELLFFSLLFLFFFIMK